MKKIKLVPILITLIVWFCLFYVALPAINIQSQEFWSFAIMLIVIAVVINMWTIVKSFSFVMGDREHNKQQFMKFKALFIVAAAIACFYVGGSLLSSPILRASSYRSLIDVKQSEFNTDITETDFSQIPILDKDSAAQLSERKMGSMVDMVSQYEVSDYYTQINYNQRPVRVTPLEYASPIKWLTNRDTGIPAYIRIDMSTQDVELIKLQDGIKYSPSEYFGRNLYRYLRFKYPTAMFRTYNFEIDDNGDPYWICPVQEKTIGLFGGADIKGAVILNAITGEHQYYDVKDIPQWVDKVYDAELLVQQYNYYGTLVNGYLNSIFGQRGCLQSTEGYNYIALNDDVWVYTGITSISGDQSIVGFVLMNQRTKETNYYQISGAKETSAMSSAEGQVQHLGYRATFPLLLNVGGEPTYFLALKDGAGLVKKYAMVNIEKYQIVATGDSVKECEKAYKALMSSNGISTSTNNSLEDTVTGKILDIKDIVIDGNTVYYFIIDSSDYLFELNVKDNITFIKNKVGDTVKIEFSESLSNGVKSIINMENIGENASDLNDNKTQESESIPEKIENNEISENQKQNLDTKKTDTQSIDSQI